MWFKNLQVYQLEQPWTMPAGDLEAALLKVPGDVDMPALSVSSAGWVAPTPIPGLVQGVDRQMLIAYRQQHKVIPATAVKDAVKKRAADWERERGFKPGRKMIREMKDQVITEMLPRALVKASVTRAWVDPVAGRIVVDTPSASRAEALLTLLRTSIDSLAIALPQVQLPPGEAMTLWLATGMAPGSFQVGDECELIAKDDSKPLVRYLRQSIVGNHPLQQQIGSGFRVSKLGMVWKDAVSLVVNDRLQVRKIDYLDIAERDAGTAEASPELEFETAFTLMTSQCSALIGDLLAAFNAT